MASVLSTLFNSLLTALGLHAWAVRPRPPAHPSAVRRRIVSVKAEASGFWACQEGARVFFPWELLVEEGHQPTLVDCVELPGAKAIMVARLTPMFGLTHLQAQQLLAEIDIFLRNWQIGKP